MNERKTMGKKKDRIQKPAQIFTAVADMEKNALGAAHDRGYRQGMREGRRLQRSADRTKTLVLTAAASVAAQIPYLVILLAKRKLDRDRKAEAERAKDAEAAESIRRTLAEDLGKYRK